MGNVSINSREYPSISFCNASINNWEFESIMGILTINSREFSVLSVILL